MRLRHLIMLAWLAGTWVAMPASGGYLVDSRGAVVRNSYGECWRTGSWTPAQAIAECDPELVAKEVPKQASSPVPIPPSPPEPKAAPWPAPVAEAPAAMTKGMKSKADTAAISIRYHRWAPILKKGTEGRNFPDYGIYTYVLFGRNPAVPKLDQAILTRYEKVLMEVQALPTALPTKPPTAEKASTNLFCVPVNGQYFSKLSLDTKTYGYQLSQEYLSGFRLLLKQGPDNENISPSLDRAAGPFLIATLRPLGSIVKTEGGQMKIAASKAPILFIDLTHTHHQVIAEMVDAFKLEVIDISLDHHQRFRSLRVALIDLLKKADDHVTPVRQASAGFMPKEEKKKGQPPKPASR